MSIEPLTITRLKHRAYSLHSECKGTILLTTAEKTDGYCYIMMRC